MNSKVIIVLLFAVICMASAMVCPKDYCLKVDCGNKVEQNDCQQNRNGVYREHGTFCGCCPACLLKLEEGQSCWPAMIRGLPPRVACADGLKCDPQTTTCVKV